MMRRSQLQITCMLIEYLFLRKGRAQSVSKSHTGQAVNFLTFSFYQIVPRRLGIGLNANGSVVPSTNHTQPGKPSATRTAPISRRLAASGQTKNSSAQVSTMASTTRSV
ncbi:hypothetical protein DFS34DRAFT_328602 [Phlyctochytrium arcticum]|nr:hypothetical protein DFS34DRAFT_328602 [Phlyctochytrium arcticum]